MGTSVPTHVAGQQYYNATCALRLPLAFNSTARIFCYVRDAITIRFLQSDSCGNTAFADRLLVSAGFPWGESSRSNARTAQVIL